MRRVTAALDSAAVQLFYNKNDMMATAKGERERELCFAGVFEREFVCFGIITKKTVNSKQTRIASCVARSPTFIILKWVSYIHNNNNVILVVCIAVDHFSISIRIAITIQSAPV